MRFSCNSYIICSWACAHKSHKKTKSIRFIWMCMWGFYRCTVHFLSHSFRHPSQTAQAGRLFFFHSTDFFLMAVRVCRLQLPIFCVSYASCYAFHHYRLYSCVCVCVVFHVFLVFFFLHFNRKPFWMGLLCVCMCFERNWPRF